MPRPLFWHETRFWLYLPQPIAACNLGSTNGAVRLALPQSFGYDSACINVLVWAGRSVVRDTCLEQDCGAGNRQETISNTASGYGLKTPLSYRLAKRRERHSQAWRF